jgi:hypothetical protein
MEYKFQTERYLCGGGGGALSYVRLDLLKNALHILRKRPYSLHSVYIYPLWVVSMFERKDLFQIHITKITK